MNAHEFSVTIGMDALRLSIGLKPKTHSVDTIIRWLEALAARLALNPRGDVK